MFIKSKLFFSDLRLEKCTENCIQITKLKNFANSKKKKNMTDLLPRKQNIGDDKFYYYQPTPHLYVDFSAINRNNSITNTSIRGSL